MTVDVQGSTAICSAGGWPEYEYTHRYWDTSDGQTAVQERGDDSPVQFTFPAPGNYTIYMHYRRYVGGELRAFTGGESVVVSILAPANQEPVASFVYDSNVLVGQGARFWADASYDPDGSIASYSWSFGDGYGAAGAGCMRVEHAYAAPGEYVATLTVWDNNGVPSSNQLYGTVVVTSPPPGGGGGGGPHEE